MKAMIFSAGLGTRFKPWTDKHPKALAPVNGKPLLQRNVEYLQQYGIKNIIVNVHHFADQLIETIKAYNCWGSRILISDESDELLDTGGGLLKAQSLFDENERFITLNADILTDLDINKLLTFHLEKNAVISFGVTDRKTSRYLLFDKDSRLCGWRNVQTGLERISRSSDTYTAKAYSCVVVFEYEIFRLMKEKGFSGKFSLIDVYLALANDHIIMGYDHTGDRFVDVGKPEATAEAEQVFL
jgi:NDP-sugar pyrophosphorylase family protein